MNIYNDFNYCTLIIKNIKSVIYMKEIRLRKNFF